MVTVQFQGWTGKQSGELMRLIDGNFDVFLNGDKNLRYQQRIDTRKIAMIELPFTLTVEFAPEDPEIPSTYRGQIQIQGEFQIHETFDEKKSRSSHPRHRHFDPLWCLP